jgi:anti-sigma-K factor RskA
MDSFPPLGGPSPAPLDGLPPRERLEALSAYLDGELPADEAREVTAWLERHPEALREVEHQRRLWDLLGRYPDEPVPSGFAARVLDSVGASSGASAAAPHVVEVPQRPVRRVWAWAAAAAVLAAVGAGVFALAQRRGGEAPASGDLLTAFDADFVQHADLAQLADLSDAQFQVLLVDDPDALADANLGGAQGG